MTAVYTLPADTATGWGDAVRAAVDTANKLGGPTAATLRKQVTGRTRYRRGVNLSGAEFATGSASTVPGIYGTDYAYPTDAEIAAMAARGHTAIRLPIRAERVQVAPGGALISAETGRILAFIATARTYGLTTVVEIHNFARWITSGGTLVLGQGWTVAQFVDLWVKLSTLLQPIPDVEYELMNEPYGLAAVAGTLSGSVRYNFNDGTVQGWTGDSMTASNPGTVLRVSATVSSGTVYARKDDAGTVAGGATITGNVLSATMTLGTGSPTGTWVAHLEWQNSGYTWQTPTSTTYTRVDTGAVVSGLIPGVAVTVASTFSTIASPPRAFALQIDGTGVAAGTLTVDVDDISQGTPAGAMTDAQVWENACQQVVTGIRGNGDLTRIYIPGYSYQAAQNWANSHPNGPFVTDPAANIVYAAHYYFDTGNSGVYGSSYATENTNAGTSGLVGRATRELGVFLSWCTAWGVRGAITEMGWPNNGDTASWNAVGAALYGLLDAAEMSVFYWAAGARWGTGYNLSLYTGTAQNVVCSQAAVVEAHPTLTADGADLSRRITTLDSGGGARCAPPHRGLAFMVIDATSATDLATAKSAGCTHGLVEVKWDQCQSSAGGAVDATAANATITRILAAGLKVCVRVSIQYSPSFVQSGVPQFKSLTGTLWSGTQANGDNIRDWVWTSIGRQYVRDFLDKLFVQIDMSRVERMQLGGGAYGELSYPVSDGTVWWGGGAAAQSGTGIAPRMTVCPVAGHTPSTGTSWTDDDDAFVAWYQASLTQWMLWLIEQHRRWFSGDIWVMHPGSGLRKNSQSPTNSQASNYRISQANGLDWYWQLGAYPDSKIHPYSTWVDSLPNYSPAPYSDANDGNAAPWYHLARVARACGRGRLWGENTGGQSAADMTRLFQGAGGIPLGGYEGAVWLNAGRLNSGENGTSWSGLASLIAAATTY